MSLFLSQQENNHVNKTKTKYICMFIHHNELTEATINNNNNNNNNSTRITSIQLPKMYINDNYDTF